jgi:hypothetical protein
MPMLGRRAQVRLTAAQPPDSQTGIDLTGKRQLMHVLR